MTDGAKATLVVANLDATVCEVLARVVEAAGHEAVRVTDPTQVSAAVLQGKVVSVSVPDFYLIDIGKKSGGITASQATRQVMNAMTNNVTKSVAFLKLDGVMGSVKKGAAAVSDKVKGWFK